MTHLPPFEPLAATDGYLPIEAHGCIGDGSTAALVARDGAVSWLCAPRFDSPPLFCAILDARRGGAFRLSVSEAFESRQFYERDTAVLHTEVRSASGLLRITDALTLHAGADLSEDVPAARRELIRLLHVIEGEIVVTADVAPRSLSRSEPESGAIRMFIADNPDLELHFSASRPLQGLRTTFTLGRGEKMHFIVRWSATSPRHRTASAEETVDRTAHVWRHWMDHFRYQGPQHELVRRSAVTLKLLDHFENGAIVAAPTSSLPEAIGGVRNWDYRYAWIRDAALSVFALHRIGHSPEAARFLSWVLDAVERDGSPHVLYNIDGEQPQPERTDPDLEGYRKSPPVRWGNGAASQIQHDVYGEILDCAYQWVAHHGEIDASTWQRLTRLIEAARVKWRAPDHGIWEVRTPGRAFTYSAAMCQVALDRGARIAQRFGLPGDAAAWSADAANIREVLLAEAWDSDKQSLTEHLGGGGLDASLLALPLRRVIPARHPKMVATTNAVVKRLGTGDGLLYRYLPDESPDGLPGHEGAFLLCSFWLVDNLASQGRLDEALELYDSLCSRAGSLGLLPEQIDPATGAFLGNYPQGFSHIGVIASGWRLGRLLEAR